MAPMIIEHSPQQTDMASIFERPGWQGSDLPHSALDEQQEEIEEEGSESVQDKEEEDGPEHSH